MTNKKINKQDQDLFRLAIGDVTEIKSDKPHLNTNKKPSTRPRSQQVDYQEHLNRSISLDSDTLGLGDPLSFVAPGLQKNVLKKIRNGFFGIDAESDLHGLSRTQAQQQLLRFLHLSNQNGWRCVCIIHGKGYRSTDNQPILKNSVNQWLRQHRDVLAFCSAKPADGGTGAVYVLLKLSNKYDDQEPTE